MVTRRSALLRVLFLLPAGEAAQATERSMAVRNRWRKTNPCPSTLSTRGRCPGWEIDHVVPLCEGGADHGANLQWLTVDDHRIKTRADRQRCRLKKR